MKRIALVLLLALSAILPAFAQTPIPALPDTERRTTYTISAQTGPFNVGMDLYCDGTDYAQCVQVWLNGVQLTAVSQWTMDLASGTLATSARPLQNARVTLTSAGTGTLQIVGARRPRRTSQFTEGVGITAHQLNQVLTDITAWSREDWDARLRAIVVPPGDPPISGLPSQSARAGKFWIWDGNGNPSVTSPTVGLGNVVGPGSSVAGHIAVFSGVSGTLLADGGSAPAAFNPIDVFPIGGQSNAEGTSNDVTLSPSVPTGKVLQYTGTYVGGLITLGAIVDANDPVGNAVVASAWPAFGNAYYEATGRPILFVPSAVGGTDQCATTGVGSAHWDLGGTLAPTLVANVSAAMAAARAAGYTPILRGILWSQGENDAGSIGNNTTWPVNGATTVTGGPYTAGTTVITVASATGISTNEGAVISLDNGSTFTAQIANVAGTTVTLGVGVPVGRTINTGAALFVYSSAFYRTCFRNMLNYFRTTTIDGTTFPQLPFYVSLTGSPSTGDVLGYQKVARVQEQIGNIDPYTRIVFRGARTFAARGMMQAASLHYLQEGYNEMGRGMAQGVISAQAADQFVKTNETVSRIVLGGTLRNGDQMVNTITSTAITGSPVQLGPLTVVVPPGSTFASLATAQAQNCNLFSPQLDAVGIYCTSYATPSGAVIEVHQPAALSPQAIVTGSWTTGGATETMTISPGASAQGSTPYPPAAWTTYPPSPNCGTATLTTNAARQKVNALEKTASFMIDVTIAALGTCSGNQFAFSLPVISGQAAAFAGREVSVVGYGLACSASAAAGNAVCFRYDGSLTWAVNHRLVVSGTYETQ